MSDYKSETLALLVGNLAIFGTLVYLVAERGWNPWWMGFILICNFSREKA